MSDASFNRIYLASQSPRRRELLRQIGVAHDLLLIRSAAKRAADVDESPDANETPQKYVERVCREKATAAARAITLRGLPEQPVLAADTTVCIDGKILGKPDNGEHAAAMFAQLAGRSHQVHTAVALQWNNKIEAKVSSSVVSFRALDAAEIKRYIASGEPLDKAGAYAIQGRAAAFIARLEGSYSGVMGLPLFETMELLAASGYQALD
jgi:nucleoside triphosphate pyrophosphatase